MALLTNLPIVGGLIPTLPLLPGETPTGTPGTPGPSTPTTGPGGTPPTQPTGLLGNLLDHLIDLDHDGDGLVSLDLLGGNGGLLDGLDLDLLDPDGKGILDLGIVEDLLESLLGDKDGPDPDGPEGDPDPDAYETVLTGTAGRDSFTIGAESTYVDGRGDIDTVTYAGASANFAYQPGENAIFMSDGTKIDYLLDVERVVFSDGTLILDTGIGEMAGMAYRIYQAAFDRTPDAGGLKFWMDKLDAGVSLNSIAADFIFSNEFRQTYGTDMKSAEFVSMLYENILGRSGEAAGITYWTGQIDSGAMNAAQVLGGFSESQENVDLVGAAIGDGFWLA